MSAQIIDLKKNKKGINVAVSIVAAIFLVSLYIIIFFFSEQDGEETVSMSHKVTVAIVEQVENITSKSWSRELKDAFIDFWEHPVRKIAHFSEYTAMGIFVFLMLIPWKKPDLKLYGIVIAWVFLSASLDEFHQTFVTGREGTFLDVLLDTSGGFFGLLLSMGGYHLFPVILKLFGRNERTSQNEENTVGEGRLLAAVVTASLFVLLFLLHQPLFGLNDDMLIESILSGAYFEPTAFTHYFSLELGLIFSVLYRIFPVIPWYGLFCLFGMAGCLYTILKRVIRNGKNTGERYGVLTLSILFITAILWKCFVLYHYTVVAAIFGMTGLAVLTLTEKRKDAFTAMTCFLLCYLVRENVFFMMVPWAALVLLYLAVRNRGRSFRPAVSFILGFCGVFLVLFVINRINWNKDWAQYREYNSVRTDVYDYYKVDSSEAAMEYYAARGMTEEELEIFSSYDLALFPSDNGNLEGLQILAEYGKERQASTSARLIRSLKEYIHRIGLELTDFPWNFLTILVYIALLALCIKKKQNLKLLIVLAMAAYRSLFWIFLIFRGRYPDSVVMKVYYTGYPERVTLSFYLMELIVLLLIFWKETGEYVPSTIAEIRKCRYWRRGTGIFLGVVFLIASVPGIIRTGETYRQHTEINEDAQYLMDYMETNSDSFFFLDVNAVVQRTRPAISFDGIRQENYLWLGGWMIEHPLYHEKLKILFPKEQNILQILQEEDHVYLVLKDGTGIAKETVENCLGIRLTLTEQVKGTFSTFCIYSAKRD